MGTIAGSAIDLDVLYLAPVGENNNNNNNTSSSSRPSSRLANAQPSSSSPTTKTNAFNNAAGENTNKEGNVTVVVDAGTTDDHQTTSDGIDAVSYTHLRAHET